MKNIKNIDQLSAYVAKQAEDELINFLMNKHKDKPHPHEVFMRTVDDMKEYLFLSEMDENETVFEIGEMKLSALEVTRLLLDSMSLFMILSKRINGEDTVGDDMRKSKRKFVEELLKIKRKLPLIKEIDDLGE